MDVVEDYERSMRDSKSLAGLFQNLVNDCKALHPSLEDFIDKSRKLETQLKSTLVTLAAFNGSLYKIAEKAVKTKAGSSQDIGESLMKISEHNKLLKTFMTSLTRLVL